MELPSIHAPNGLSESDRKRAITVGPSRRSQIRTEPSSSFNAGSYAPAPDIEMMAIDDMEESRMISDIVASSRSETDFSASDEMELDRHILQTSTVALQGNVSYLIIDTNFILSQLLILDELKTIGERYGIVIVIPIQVVRELDGLKGSENRASNEQGGLLDIGKLARRANDWIFSCLAQRCPTVKGQGLKEKIDRYATKDDAILDCCLYYKEEYKHTLQILFSNDKNLCLKALMNDVLTISFHKDMSAQLIAEKIYQENMMRFGYIDPNSVASVEVEVPSPVHAQSPEQITESIYAEILKVACHIVGLYMRAEYGDDISLIRDYDANSTVSLEDAVMVIIRFWRPVFSQSLRGGEPFEEHHGRSTPIMVDPPRSAHDLLQFVDFWESLLLKLYEKNSRLDGLEVIQIHAKKWKDLAHSLVAAEH
ncbi:hypothetical protein METBIDRAFT_48001 [Metschnikowia bicuspidata var. bicuspidata NRRL YB-4993]|uniref:Transcriptional protein SWT1 n=1 Tax=Metschnikowia bicuspidata var. bicuspidata NRRL YB-4993 TaxID=869754 RepID=A0A1A0GZ68_9ASCO|nr:hypothetical protein METBIDRAFT_48001 [Metschnikowia bicuspidata var. bicuspidata NRRL YB-4993]OBA16992.1 hypothetical protein METBIDRAFT_48001 [Metschnikowia bicuspidata var. bicuspidata NRRL YB-4993]